MCIRDRYSAYLYLDMANYYASKGLDGFSNWFEIQAKEEQDHAMLIYRYLHNNNQQVTFCLLYTSKWQKARQHLMNCFAKAVAFALKFVRKKS